VSSISARTRACERREECAEEIVVGYTIKKVFRPSVFIGIRNRGVHMARKIYAPPEQKGERRCPNTACMRKLDTDPLPCVCDKLTICLRAQSVRTSAALRPQVRNGSQVRPSIIIPPAARVAKPNQPLCRIAGKMKYARRSAGDASL
jgi:hypothetical protein